MNRTFGSLIFVLAAALGGIGLAASAAEDQEVIYVEDSEEALAGYHAQLRALSDNGGVLAPSVASGSDCDTGSIEWRRDRSLRFCARVCTVDEDCAAGEERCRVFSLDSPYDDASSLAAESDTDIAVDTISLCDPFWSVDGALSID